MIGRHDDGEPGRGKLWFVTVTSKDGSELISHATAEDLKEVQAIATIARGESLSTRIWIRPPIGKLYSWD
jgi:hypothetical protein